jgi:hypothetical protein
MYKQCNPVFQGAEVTSVIRLIDGAVIPFDPDNTDYQAFLKYQADGGKVYGADEEVPNGQTS